jgi:hypothetical protein
VFTADKSIVLYKAGTITQAKTKEVEDALVKMFRA